MARLLMHSGTPFDDTPFEGAGTPFEDPSFEGSISTSMYIFWAAYLHPHTVSSTPVSFINPFVSTSNRFLSSHLFEFEGGLYTVSCSSHLMAHSLSRPLGAPPQSATTVRHDPINCPDIDSGQLLQWSNMTP
ncbi:hypothetical protein HYC85_030173 [Camellia sinensis]|uniref:Uncharacterized protein n=1 Tax=Camellia sinensis TaxID=4442 RepID=A0A7J7FZZ9_CAMSI|nr:hypothetical protein HYC85_030173 [Camellia sinensis]